MSTAASVAPTASSAFEKESPLLPKGLPPLALRGLAIFLIALFVVAVLIAMLVHFPESARGTFNLVPEHGSNPLTSARQGVITKVQVEDGQDVKEGQILFVIRSSELRVLAAEKLSLEQESASTKERLRELENESKARALADTAARLEMEARLTRLEREAKENEYNDATLEERHKMAVTATKAKVKSTQEIVEIEHRRFELVKKIQAKSQDSYKQGIIPEWDSLREQYSYQVADVELAQADFHSAEAGRALLELENTRKVEVHDRMLARVKLEGEIAETNASLNKLKKDSEAREVMALDRARQLRLTLEKADAQIVSLARELQGAEGDLLSVKAPFSGTVIKLTAQRAGDVIERGGALCSLAPTGETLVAEVSIPEKEAGLVSKGQEAKILFTSFPHTRFGTRTGKVTWLSPASTGQGVLRAFITFENKPFVLNGKNRELQAGMSGEVHILTGERTLIDFALQPLKQMKENILQP